MYITALPAAVQSIGLHALPGLLSVILASVLLFVWEFRRLTKPGRAGMQPWLLPAAGIALSVLSFAFITARFVVIH
jgi:hypothetical protein